MKKVKKIGVLFTLLATTFTLSAYQTLPDGCVTCSKGNDGWCRGVNIKACLDAGSQMNSRCLIGATKLSDCKNTPE